MGSLVSVTAAPTNSGLSAEDRWNNISQFTIDYLEYLSTSGGVVLPVETRLQVAQMAMDATSCAGCAALPQDACFRKGVDIYETLRSLETHDDESRETVLLLMVHSIINHQGRLTKTWYETTLEKLDECGWIEEKDAPRGSEKRHYLLYSLFSEIALVATTVHCLNTTHLIMDKEMPPLPDPSPDATLPTGFDWSLAVKPGKSPMPRGCWAPFLKASDVDPDSPPLKNLDAKTRKNHFKYGMGHGPHVALNWSVVDTAWFHRMMGLMYLEPNDMRSMFSPLPSEKRCAQSFSRRDVEFIAFVIADTYGCAF